MNCAAGALAFCFLTTVLLPTNGAAQSLANLAALQGLAPASALANTPAGKAVLSANFAVTGAIQTCALRRDCRKIGGAPASWVLLRLFSDRGWMRGLDVEVGEDRG